MLLGMKYVSSSNIPQTMTLSALKPVPTVPGYSSRRILSTQTPCFVDNIDSNKNIIETNSIIIKKSTNTTNDDYDMQTSWATLAANHTICFLQTCVKAIVKLFVEHKDDYKMLNITDEKVFELAKKGISSTLSGLSNISLGHLLSHDNVCTEIFKCTFGLIGKLIGQVFNPRTYRLGYIHTTTTLKIICEFASCNHSIPPSIVGVFLFITTVVCLQQRQQLGEATSSISVFAAFAEGIDPVKIFNGVREAFCIQLPSTIKAIPKRVMKWKPLEASRQWLKRKVSNENVDSGDNSKKFVKFMKKLSAINFTMIVLLRTIAEIKYESDMKKKKKNIAT